MTEKSKVVILPTPRVKEARQKIEKHFDGAPAKERMLAGFDQYIAGNRTQALKLLFPMKMADLAMFLVICKAHHINLRAPVG